MTRGSGPYGGVDWTTDEWLKAWTVRVGKAYRCLECDTLVMSVKGGVGVLEPLCCGKPMQAIEDVDSIRDADEAL
jgi:hypothetical protein